MRIAIITNEYPPHIYGGAGVHVEYLTRELARVDGGSHDIEVLSFGDQEEATSNLRVRGIAAQEGLVASQDQHRKFLDTMARNVLMSGMIANADIVHGHTWYSHLAGCLIKQLAGAKLVLTTHSLEPHRPWKVEQLGTAYNASSWVEKTAYQNADGIIAVSNSMREDVHTLYDIPYDRIEVIPNGIDTSEYRPTYDPDLLRAYDIDPNRPFILFVGRITRQKGILHLVRAIRHLTSEVQVVLCAGAPDTPEIGDEMKQLVEQACRETSRDIIWIADMLPRSEIIVLYSHAEVFVCPSVYEPFGIINLEAMACETPVVASAVGGIPSVVRDGETGLLVKFDARGDTNFEPVDAEQYARDLAEAVDSLLSDPDKMKKMGSAARARVEANFAWQAIARRTLDFYQNILERDRA